MIKNLNKNGIPTDEAMDLKEALEKRGILVYKELDNGHIHIDLTIPKAKINVEVDGIQHLTNPKQILSDLNRGYYSHKDGYCTMHIPNEMIHKHLNDIAEALAEASKMRKRKMQIHVNNQKLFIN